jgi:hypothetical protein
VRELFDSIIPPSNLATTLNRAIPFFIRGPPMEEHWKSKGRGDPVSI